MGIHAQVQILTDNGDLKDAITNTFDFQTGPSNSAADHSAIQTALDAFYNTATAGQPRALSAYFSHVLQQASGMILKTYDIPNEPTPPVVLGAPRLVQTVSIAAPMSGTFPLPSHLACVLTREAAGFMAQPVEIPSGSSAPSTRPRSRYRGRLYLGPFNNGAMGTGTGNDAVPEVTFQAVVLAAWAQLDDTVRAAGELWAPAVWSRSDGILRAINSVSIDDRFDIVGRRKRYASTRTRVTVA